MKLTHIPFKSIFLSLLLIMCSTTYCQLSSARFKEIINFVTSINLEAANDQDYQEYITALTQVQESGNDTQKEILERILDGEEVSEKVIANDPTITAITAVFESDVITQNVWQDTITKIHDIDVSGTSEQKALLKTFFTENVKSISESIQGMVYNTFAQIEVKQAVQFITINTLYGVLPSVTFKSAQYFITGLDPAQASLDLIDVGILSALDSLVRYALTAAPALTSATTAAGLSTAAQDFLGFVGTRPAEIPLLGKIGRPLVASLQAIATTATMQEIERRGGMGQILRSFKWQNITTTATSAITQTTTQTYQLIQKHLVEVLNNQTTRNAISTVTNHAVEGALMGAVMHMLGLGFYESSVTSSIMLASFRGAIEGLYHFGSRQHPDLINNIQGGLLARNIQQIMVSGSTTLGIASAAPVVIQQVTKSVIENAVNTHGGWRGIINKIFPSR